MSHAECRHCGTRVERPLANCPECGGPMRIGEDSSPNEGPEVDESGPEKSEATRSSATGRAQVSGVVITGAMILVLVLAAFCRGAL